MISFNKFFFLMMITFIKFMKFQVWLDWCDLWHFSNQLFWVTTSSIHSIILCGHFISILLLVITSLRPILLLWCVLMCDCHLLCLRSSYSSLWIQRTLLSFRQSIEKLHRASHSYRKSTKRKGSNVFNWCRTFFSS